MLIALEDSYNTSDMHAKSKESAIAELLHFQSIQWNMTANKKLTSLLIASPTINDDGGVSKWGETPMAIPNNIDIVRIKYLVLLMPMF